MLPLDKIIINTHVIQSEAKDLVKTPTPCGCTTTILRDSAVSYRKPLNDRICFVK